MSKERFIEIYQKNIVREGADKLLEALMKTDFFEAPASTNYHLSEPGGLCNHSVNVFMRLLQINHTFEGDYSLETLAIVALLHDLCKIDCYKVEMRNRKNEKGEWEKYPVYTFKEGFCYGSHGAKSVYLIERYMKLTAKEAVAINCHMSAFDRVPNVDWSLGGAFEQFPLALYLSWADQAASFIDEKRG